MNKVVCQVISRFEELVRKVIPNNFVFESQALDYSKGTQITCIRRNIFQREGS